ncbi:MAG: flavodoxin family protein [Bacilli bacterium]
MAKNILVITGSARPEGNSMLLAKAFIRGARKNGNAVRRFDAATKLISPCRGCNRCWSKGKPCIVDDAFNQVAPYLHVSHIIVFATPLYWFNFSSPVKAFIDKLYAYFSDARKRDLRITQSILIAAGASKEEDAFDLLKENYLKIADTLNWENIAMITVGGVENIHDVDKLDAIKEAYELGKSIE